MNLVWAAAAVVVVTAVTVAAMLVVRGRAPEGSYFSDGDRASGVFGVLATGFSVLLGFIIFLAFTSYDDSRSGAETEATIVAQQLQTAQFLPDGAAEELSGELICYARSVAGAEWDAMPAGTLGDSINPWGAEMFRTVSAVHPRTATEQSAYDRWMDQTVDREQARICAGPRSGGNHPRTLVAGPHRALRGDLRVHAVLRRPGRGRGDAGSADGERDGGHRAAAPPAHVLQPSAR
jgi:hypothetical protein